MVDEGIVLLMFQLVAYQQRSVILKADEALIEKIIVVAAQQQSVVVVDRL